MTAKKSALKGFSPVRRYTMDSDAETKGVWRDIEGGAARLKLARFNNPEHTALLRSLRNEHAEVLENPSTPEAQKVLEQIGNQALAAHILLDWEGILGEDGESPLPFTPENVAALLALEEFSALVFSLSTEVEQYRKYKEEKAVKN